MARGPDSATCAGLAQWRMGVIIAIVERLSKSHKIAFHSFFYELSKIFEKRRPH